MRTSLKTAVAVICLTASATNSAPAQAAWRLVEVTRIGGADEGLASFNSIRDVQLDASGQVWVLDFQAKSLRLFAADGKPIRELARSGMGPGEIANSNGFRRMPDGRMILRDHNASRLTVFAPDGKYLTQMTLVSGGYGARLDAGVDAQGRYQEATSQRLPDGNIRSVIVRVNAELTATDTTAAPGAACSALPPPPPPVRVRNAVLGLPFGNSAITAFSPSGAYWCGSTGEYRVRRFAFGSETHDLEVRRDIPRIPIPAATRDSAIAGLEKLIASMGGAPQPLDKGAVPRDRGPLIGIATDDRDRLWVMRETANKTAELDVWDARGRQVATLAPGFAARAGMLFRIHGDRLAVVLLDEDELPTIFVYRIVTN
jgi:hypothetical protein